MYDCTTYIRNEDTMNIKDKLKDLFAEKLADAIQPAFEEAAGALVEALSEVSLRDLVELTEGGGGGGEKPGRKAAAGRTKGSSTRLPRRSVEEIDAAADKVVSLLKTKKNGMRAEEIRAKLKMDVRELPRVIKAALVAKKITVLSGAKRSTTYGIKAAKAAKPTKAKPAKRAAAKKANATKANSKANSIEEKANATKAKSKENSIEETAPAST